MRIYWPWEDHPWYGRPEKSLEDANDEFHKWVKETLFDPSYDEIADGYTTRFRMLMGGVPLIGDILRAQDNYRYYDDYLRNRGLSWSDVKYPTRLNSGLGGAYGTLNYVSKNILRLYK